LPITACLSGHSVTILFFPFASGTAWADDDDDNAVGDNDDDEYSVLVWSVMTRVKISSPI
jgi:hypothetical protein